MTVYVVAQLTFKNRAAYDRYQAAFANVFRQFEGRLLAADESPQILEGDRPCDKLVLMSFPDEQACREWSDSVAYRRIAEDRRAGADAVVMRVTGLGR